MSPGWLAYGRGRFGFQTPNIDHQYVPPMSLRINPDTEF